MPRILKALGIVLLALVAFVPVASAQPRGGFHGGFHGGRFRGGGGFHGHVFVGGGFYGPGFWEPGWYNPYFYGYDPYYEGYYAPTEGKVEIKTKEKGDSILVDGGFAGRTGELKNFELGPGTHTVEVRAPDGKSLYQERINVLAGRTIKIYPDMPEKP